MNPRPGKTVGGLFFSRSGVKMTNAYACGLRFGFSASADPAGAESPRSRVLAAHHGATWAAPVSGADPLVREPCIGRCRAGQGSGFCGKSCTKATLRIPRSEGCSVAFGDGCFCIDSTPATHFGRLADKPGAAISRTGPSISPQSGAECPSPEGLPAARAEQWVGGHGRRHGHADGKSWSSTHCAGKIIRPCAARSPGA